MTGTVIWSVLGFRKIALCPFLQKRTDSATPRWVLCHTNTVQINDLDLHVSTWVNFINKILNFWRFAVAERYWIILFTYILTIKKHLCLLWKCKNRNEGQAWITVYWSLLKRRPVTGPQGFQYLCSQDRLYHLGSFFFFWRDSVSLCCQGCLQLLDSTAPPAAASQRITGVRHHAWPHLVSYIHTKNIWSVSGKMITCIKS